MIKEIKELFNDEILSKAAHEFGTTPDKIKLLGGFESFVYEFENSGQPYILKITHTLRRTFDQLMGELEFINHLAMKGVDVSRAVKSVNGNLVEQIPALKGTFLAYVFEKAPGDLIDKKEWNADLLYKWGRLTAEINLHTQDFCPSDELYRREHWKVEMKAYFNRFLPESESEVREKGYALFDKLDCLPRTKESFGLVHTDLHHWNFFHHEGKLTAFDFDDCTYQYFAHEIAIPLYYSLGDIMSDMTKADYIEFFKKHFIGGYTSIMPLSDFWMKTIPDFLRLRHILMYSVLYQAFGDNMNEKQIKHLAEHKKDIFDDKWADQGFL